MRGLLIPPVPAVGDLIGDIRLLGLVVVIEVPGQIADRTDHKNDQEQHALRGLARQEIREEVRDGLQGGKALQGGERLVFGGELFAGRSQDPRHHRPRYAFLNSLILIHALRA